MVPKSAPAGSSFKKKLILRMLSSPLTMGLFLAGATVLLAAWTFGINSGLAIFAGIVSILGAIGVFFTRFLLGSERLGREVLEEMRQEAEMAREKALDELDRKLSADGDPRTEWSLRDLRALAKAFNEGRAKSDALSAPTTFDITAGVEQLFSRCALFLERTIELWYAANNTTDPEARRPLLDQRERIIEDVGKSIKQLGGILAGLQGLGVGDASEDSDLARIREELDQSLEVAKIVDKRMKSLERELGSRDIGSGGAVV